MKKSKKINLNEAFLHNVIKESVKKVLKEENGYDSEVWEKMLNEMLDSMERFLRYDEQCLKQEGIETEGEELHAYVKNAIEEITSMVYSSN